MWEYAREYRNIFAQRIQMIYCYEHIVEGFNFFLKAFWSAFSSVVLTRLTSPADAYKDYVTTYRSLPSTCRGSSMQACQRVVAKRQVQILSSLFYVKPQILLCLRTLFACS